MYPPALDLAGGKREVVDGSPVCESRAPGRGRSTQAGSDSGVAQTCRTRLPFHGSDSYETSTPVGHGFDLPLEP